MICQAPCWAECHTGLTRSLLAWSLHAGAEDGQLNKPLTTSVMCITKQKVYCVFQTGRKGITMVNTANKVRNKYED